MSRLKYVSARREEVELDGDLAWSGAAADMRGRTWTYRLGRRGATGMSLDARKAELDTVFLDESEADRLRRLADRDLRERTPGTLVVGGEWSRTCYIVASEPSGIFAGHHKERMTIALLGSGWRRERLHRFAIREHQASDGGYDYRHDWGLDYMRGPEPRFIDGGMLGESDFKLVVFGPVSNPSVTIGGNVYSLRCDVPAGGHVIVDSTDCTIVAVTRQGALSNAFKAGERGGGKGSGRYIFQPIPEGVLDVSASGEFGFDLVVYESESEPPWSA
ncbi:hypothetical protein [Slackia exigua]|uniref:hypothetical protein n=1 Tax=Slackia exigua TaxID=84109 RepID=UPI0023F25D31|nr:hypothetical protein [Slackia exigua]